MYTELTPIDVQAKDQRFALISFVSPQGPQKSSTCGFRIYGAFETLDEAKEHARAVSHADDRHDVYVTEMYKWCAWNPDPTEIDSVHPDERLNTLLLEHRKAQQAAHREFQSRLDVPQAPQAPEAPDA
jgi:hypothetical protein